MKAVQVIVALVSTVGLTIAFVLLALFGDSVGGPQNTFAPAGHVAKEQKDLFLIALWPAIAVLVLVFAAIAYIIVRFRQRSEDEPAPPQVHGNLKLELTWTIAPALLLIALAVPMLMTLVDLGEAASDDAMVVDVTGQRFGWIFQYPSITDGDGQPLSTPGELHVPVGREVKTQLHSADVIHSFWVQRLFGKQDVVPGHDNTLVFRADEPGEYPGQCAEFCGLLHADMKFTVIAHTPEDFQAWCEEALGEPGAAGCQPVVPAEE